MTVLLQVSDAHFGRERNAVVEALVQLTASLAPDIVVLSGDITQRALRSEFARAAAFAERLRSNALMVIPGNHDVPLFNVFGRLLDPYGGMRRAFGRSLDQRFSAPDCLVLGVNTTRRYRHAQGEISGAQRTHVAGELRAASPEQLRVVVTHHPVFVPRVSEQKDRVHGAEAAVRSWATAGADIILSGHIHLPFVVALHEEIESLANPLWAVGAGTSVSRRTRYDAGNAVNVLRTSAGRPRSCTVEIWVYSAEEGAFALGAHKELDPLTPPAQSG